MLDVQTHENLSQEHFIALGKQLATAGYSVLTGYNTEVEADPFWIVAVKRIEG